MKMMYACACLLLMGLSSTAAAAEPADGPTVTTVVRNDAGWQLLRDGKPYFIKGAGGSAPKEFLAACSGNSFRTWGADDLEDQLDEAQRLGLSVTVGIWLGHERHGFDYTNADQVAKQYAQAMEYVKRYKDHPAVLMWGLGNEMEGYAEGDNAAIWSAIEAIAAGVKRIDPNHPTMTVIAEIGGDRIKNIQRLCPSIDVIGINTYGGVTSILQRYAEAGGTKPYVITEFGPPGVWEVGRNKFDAPVELTSTEKAESYRQAYARTITSQTGRCLGSYVFAWGFKQEATATWYGMFLPDGSKLAAVDVATEVWSGKTPENRCPTITAPNLDGSDELDPGQTVQVSVKTSDPDGDDVKVSWMVYRDSGNYNTGGDTQATPPKFPEAIIEASGNRATIKAPKDGGVYRVFAYAHDGKKAAAVSNAMFRVNGPQPKVTAQAGKKAAVGGKPFVVYGDGVAATYIASGYMGSTDAISMDEKCTDNPKSGETCLKVQYRKTGDWGGVVWQSPANDWGDQPGGYDLTGATQLSFWARGADGGEKVKVGLGIIGSDKTYHDTAKTEQTITLTQQWKQYTLNLKGKDLSRIKTGFMWVVGGQGKPLTFYLDDIRYENTAAR